MERRTATRERLMAAAMSKFAEQGYEATSVGEIESAAKLAPRSGALYQHFRGGKEELLHAAVERELEAIDELGSVMGMLPLGDFRSELTLLARWNLSSLERRSTLAQLVGRESGRLPPALRERLYDRLVERPYAEIVSWLQQRFAGIEPQPDFPAMALVLIESMSAYKWMRRTFGRTPDAVDDERFVAAWVEAALAVAQRFGLEP